MEISFHWAKEKGWKVWMPLEGSG